MAGQFERPFFGEPVDEKVEGAQTTFGEWVQIDLRSNDQPDSEYTTRFNGPGVVKYLSADSRFEVQAVGTDKVRVRVKKE